jgi:hypothetical protein
MFVALKIFNSLDVLYSKTKSFSRFLFAVFEITKEYFLSFSKTHFKVKSIVFLSSFICLFSSSIFEYFISKSTLFHFSSPNTNKSLFKETSSLKAILKKIFLFGKKSYHSL